MRSGEEYLYERRSLLRTLGAGGSLYGLTHLSGRAGATRQGQAETATAGSVGDVDLIGISELGQAAFSEAISDIKSRIEEWISNTGWSDIVDQLQNIFDLMTSAADDALDRIGSGLEAVEAAIDKVDFVLSNTSAIIDAIEGKAEEIREELEEEKEEENSDSSGSIGSVPMTVGAGAKRSVETGAGASTATTPSITGGIGAAIDELENVADGIADFADQLSDGLRETFDDLWGAAETFVDELRDGIRSMLDPAIDAVVELVAKPLDTFEDLWESAASGAGDALPSFDGLGFDVLDIDFELGVSPVVDILEHGPAAAGATGAGTAGGTSAGAAPAGTPSSGAGTTSPAPSPEIVEIEGCPGTTGTVYGMGFELSADIPGISDLSLTPYFGLNPGKPCVYYGAEADTEIGFDITDFYNALTTFQNSWAEVADWIETETEDQIETLEAVSTLGDALAAAEDVETFLDELERQLEPHGIPLDLLMDELSPDVDLMHLLELAETLEDNVVAAVDVLKDSPVADAIVELDDVVNAIDLEEDVPGIDEIADTGGDLAEAHTREEIKEIEIEDLLRLSQSYRAFSTWLETLDDAERARIERETGVDIDAVEANLAVVTDGTLEVGEWINNFVDESLKKLLEKLQDKANELTEVTYDLAEDWDGFSCRSECLRWRRLKRAVTTIVDMTKTVAYELADSVAEYIPTTWLPGIMGWLKKYVLRKGFFLLLLLLIALWMMKATILGIASFVAGIVPEPSSSAAGILGLNVSVAMILAVPLLLGFVGAQLG